MNLLRRRFLGSSLVVLGSTLLDALTIPLWKWRSSALLETAPVSNPSISNPTAASPVVFVDVAREAGLNAPNVWGGADHKKYIIEAKGSGLAFFDYDHDGWLDIYLTNGTRFDAKWPAGEGPTSHLFKNNRDGTFTDVTEKSGLARTGWQTGVCVGDYDNDGWDDLFCCFWGHNILFHNNGDGTFTDVTRKAGVYDQQIRWGAGCTWLDYDRDGRLDIFVCNYIKLDPEKTPSKTDPPQCQWKGVPAHYGNAFPLTLRRVSLGGSFFWIELDVIADKEIETAVAVVVEPRTSGSPADLFVVDTGFARDISEGAVAIVVKKDVGSPEAAEEIVPAIVVVIADADARLPAGAGEAGLFCDVGEGSVAIVLVKMRGGSFAGWPVGIEAGSVGEIDVEPVVIVVIEKSQSAALRFDDVFFVIGAAPDIGNG